MFLYKNIKTMYRTLSRNTLYRVLHSIMNKIIPNIKKKYFQEKHQKFYMKKRNIMKHINPFYKRSICSQ